MIRSLIRCMKGYVKVRVEGYSPERFLNMCSFHGIYIWGLSPVGNAYEMYMTVSGFKKLRPLARKTHTKIFVTRKYGLPFFLIRYRKRRLFFVGAILCMVLLKLYSLFIWDIHFEGNEKWTDAALTEFLASEEVAPFMLKSQVDCQGIVKAIRKEYNDIVWVSASVDGSRLKIQIKENEDTFREEEDTHTKGEQPTDLIASSDGVITDIVTRSGVPQVHVGDEVKAGDLLVSGRIDVLNDSGETVAIRKVFGDHADQLMVSSTKSMTGHMLGAGGAIEAIFSVLALKDGFVPATINYQIPDPDCDLDIVPNEGREAEIKYAISDSLGFGGHNACLVFHKWEG